MRQTLNTFLHGFGALFALIGFCVFIGAGGNCDLGRDMATEVMPLLIKGMLLVFGGIFLTWWRV